MPSAIHVWHATCKLILVTLMAEFFLSFFLYSLVSAEHVPLVAPYGALGGRLKKSRRTLPKSFVASSVSEGIKYRKVDLIDIRVYLRQSRRAWGVFLMIPLKSDAAWVRKVYL